MNPSDPVEGDPKYLAPELMSGHFTRAADIFSLGITILELATDLDLPRGGSSWHQLRSGQVPMIYTQRKSCQQGKYSFCRPKNLSNSESRRKSNFFHQKKT